MKQSIVISVFSFVIFSCSNRDQQQKSMQHEQWKREKDSISNVQFEMAMKKATEDSMNAAKEKNKL